MEAAVVSDVEWHNAQPTVVNSAWPLCSEADAVAGTAGADILENAAKLTMSEDISDAVPAMPLVVLGLIILVASSGVGLKTQPGTAERSFGKASLLTPISTL